jgi:hypothetical protein
MINLIIFSKDRACQLDLLLRSIKVFFKGWDKLTFNIIYKYSSEDYRKGYEKVKSIHKEFNYVLETDFKRDTLRYLSTNNPLTMFGVDDDVFKEGFSLDCPEIDMLRNQDVSCVSLRMHPGINYCYTENRPTPPPNFINTNPYVWEWKNLLGDWSYPMSLDFNIFRTADISNRCHVLPYSNPNTFEGNLAAIPILKPLMVCFKKSKIFNIPVNKVQTVNGNRFGGISADFLNSKFLEGHQVDLEPLKGFENISAHQETELTLI